MVTYFNRKDLVSFGEYLLSEDRKQMIINHPESDMLGADIESRLSNVSHADFHNWMDSQKQKRAVDSFSNHL